VCCCFNARAVHAGCARSFAPCNTLWMSCVPSSPAIPR
jgi:hypothetical protein